MQVAAEKAAQQAAAEQAAQEAAEKQRREAEQKRQQQVKTPKVPRKHASLRERLDGNWMQ